MSSPLLSWIRSAVTGWKPSIVGVFKEDAEHDWPLVAGSAAELRRTLTTAGHLLPLPTEPAALANVMEIELRRHLCEAAADVSGMSIVEGTERSFPDLEFEGDAFGGGVHAVDIKCARIKPLKGKESTSLNNRIALYTGNTYFLWPDLKFSGILRPFAEYQEQISIVVLYKFDPTVPERITNVQVVAHETWRLGSKSRASATREYIGSVQRIDEIVEGRGEFETAKEFYDFWRGSARKWKKSPEAERLLRQELERRKR